MEARKTTFLPLIRFQFNLRVPIVPFYNIYVLFKPANAKTVRAVRLPMLISARLFTFRHNFLRIKFGGNSTLILRKQPLNMKMIVFRATAEIDRYVSSSSQDSFSRHIYSNASKYLFFFPSKGAPIIKYAAMNSFGRAQTRKYLFFKSERPSLINSSHDYLELLCF